MLYFGSMVQILDLCCGWECAYLKMGGFHCPVKGSLRGLSPSGPTVPFVIGGNGDTKAFPQREPFSLFHQHCRPRQLSSHVQDKYEYGGYQTISAGILF
jgi:hypothetical protein